jgi:hypothetical protein
MNCCGVLFFMWLYSNFQESVMTVMLTHGWPLCMFPGFESPRNRFWLNGIISQSVRLSPLWTGPRRRRRRRSFVPASKVASMCTVVSGGSDNDAAPFFFSTVYRCCCCCCSFYHFLPIAATPRTLRSIHRGLGNNSKQTLWDGGIFKRSFQQIFNDRHTAWTIKTQGFIQFCEFPRAN